MLQEPRGGAFLLTTSSFKVIVFHNFRVLLNSLHITLDKIRLYHTRYFHYLINHYQLSIHQTTIIKEY